MPQFNLNPPGSIDKIYSQGFLPQRNKKDTYYLDSSSRSNLSQFTLSSENRRILNKTSSFSCSISLLPQKPDIQIFKWIKELGWDFPVSSVKTVFTNHIFNILYTWTIDNNPVAYSICYQGQSLFHVAYVFYDPQYSRQHLPVRLVLQTVIDSHQSGLQYCYLGRFSPDTGYYKRSMPGFEYFDNGAWVEYNSK